MAIKQLDLKSAASRATTVKRTAARTGQTTAFLCHSHKDGELALGLQQFLREQGWDLYIDWQDSTLPDRPDRVTADRIQRRIAIADWFLFLATANSMVSRWCPWEIGYADGKNGTNRIAIVPTSDGSNIHGNEYLALYKRLDKGVYGDLEVVEPNAIRGTSVKSL